MVRLDSKYSFPFTTIIGGVWVSFKENDSTKTLGLVKSSIRFSLLKRLLEKRSQKTVYRDIHSVDGTKYEVYFNLVYITI